MDALHGRLSVAPQQLLHDELLFARVRAWRCGRMHWGKVIRVSHVAANERIYHVIYSDGSEEALTKQQVQAIAEPQDASQLTFREKRSLFASAPPPPEASMSFPTALDVGMPMPFATAPSASASCTSFASPPALRAPHMAAWGLHGMVVALLLGVFAGLAAFSSPTPWPTAAPEVPEPEHEENLWQVMWQEVLDTKSQKLEEPPKEEPQHELNMIEPVRGYPVLEWEALHEQATERLSTLDEPVWLQEEDWDAHFKMESELEGSCIELLETVLQEHLSMLLVGLGAICFAAAAVMSAAQWVWVEVEAQSDTESDWLGSPPPSGHRQLQEAPPESPQQQMPSPAIDRAGSEHRAAQTPLLHVNFAEPSLVDSASPRSQGTPPVGGLLAPPVNEAGEVFTDLGLMAPPAKEAGEVFRDVAAHSPPPCSSDMMVDSSGAPAAKLPDITVGKWHAFQDGGGDQHIAIVKVRKRLSDTQVQGPVRKIARRTLKTDTSRDIIEAVKGSDKEQKVDVSTLLPGVAGFELPFGKHIPPATQQQLRAAGSAAPPVMEEEAVTVAGTTPRRNEKRHEARSVPARTSMRFKWPSSLKQLRDMGVPDCDDVRSWLVAFNGDVQCTLTKYMEVHKQLDLTQ
mmetsp:Transcript_35983/g.66121  ORF Transcript_35983/g.66121 Transcript_35983/m.66121 type:complete len:628 (+) Transcript_35983:53-1936(+)